LTSLSESKSFQDGEISRQLQALAEENKTLTVRNQYLAEELEMKQRNKEEDQYITELKYKQYSLLVKKILGSMIELGDL
jgi:regulator of replication initiation timing